MKERNVPYKLTFQCLSTAGGTILVGCGNFRKLGLANGSRPLGHCAADYACLGSSLTVSLSAII